MARTLLGGVLAAVDSSAAGPSWAVSVMRGSAGTRVLLTSNEGRGWLPAGLFLPHEVSTPWIWEEYLDPGPDSAGSSWELIADPARTLAEFGLKWGSRIDAQLSALVSSEPINPALRKQLSDVVMEGSVRASSDLDLRVPGPDRVDRLALVGSADSLERLSAVTDAQLRSQCVELALDAHARLRRSGSRPEEADPLPGLRDRILATIQAGFDVPPHWWAELRDADNRLAVLTASRRGAGNHADLGELPTTDVSAVRGAMFERRCNELVLLLAQDPTAQRLRDSIYAHEQIVKHPLFGTPRTAVSAPETGHAARAGIAARPSAAPHVTAAPPTGAVVTTDPPATRPPVIAPNSSQGA
ncbi:hypothetical protein [Nocardia pneumoniae]|uniref:hypothetical protein n=1 Tax=Nocardia pneumoniae TaxID=228601 RepID=UPI001FE034AC|nr:hypothetical protein [Nocardia pneumoniae]